MAWHFEYAVSRPFPFRFYTSFVIIFFFIATVLLSLFNTIVTGYDLRVSYSRDPNATIAERMWYDKPGFAGISKLSPRCEPKEITVQQKFNTNKNGFIFSLSGIRHNQGTEAVPVPSMLYLNNTLEDCTINYVKIEMAKHMGRTAQQVAWQRFGPQLLAAISCSITNPEGSMRFNLTTEYDLVPPTATKRYDSTGGQFDKWPNDEWIWAAEQNLYQFVTSNNVKDPAMWWAESLMSYGWLDTALKMEKANSEEDFDTGKQWQSGTINFWPSGKTSDIKSTEFFRKNWFFLQDSGSIFYGGKEYSIPEPVTSSLDEMIYSADLLARSFYSAVSTDLGIITGANILTDEAALQEFTKDYSNAKFDLISAGPATDSYDALKTKTGKPEVTSSTIYTTYLCQTPTRKLTTTLIISVLLADLVLLRALWSILTVTATYIVKNRDPKANQCIRCAEYEHVPHAEVEILPLKAMTTSYYPVYNQPYEQGYPMYNQPHIQG